MTHANAPLTPVGRARLSALITVEGWSVRRAAERFQVSPATASKWAQRARSGAPMTDRSSRPHRSPSRTAQRLERRIVALRFTRRWGPHRIGYHLRMPRSTVERVLHRYRMPVLTHIDQATGLPVRRARPARFERARPGDLVHVDIKKQGRIPDGGGHRMLGRTIGNRNNKKKGRGYAFLQRPTTPGSITTITTDPTPASAASFPQNAFTTSRGTTASSRHTGHEDRGRISAPVARVRDRSGVRARGLTAGRCARARS